MALYFHVFPASDPHIDFIAENPTALYPYADGQLPDLAPGTLKPTLWQRITGKFPRPEAVPEIPADWPTTEAATIGPEINRRNVDLYHLLLNGTTDFVTGSGSIFQTWLETSEDSSHSAIDLTGDNEHFAFHSHQLADLIALLSLIDSDAVLSRFTEWLRARGDDYTPSQSECSEMAAELSQFASAIRVAADESKGLIWISN